MRKGKGESKKRAKGEEVITSEWTGGKGGKGVPRVHAGRTPI